MGSLLSPSQECHPFYPSPLSHDLVVRTPLKKDKNGKVIGIEKLYVSKTVGIDRPLPVELVVG